MAKYYVESGPHFQVVIEGDDFVDALLRAFSLTPDDEPLALADLIIVNERGFVWHRPDHRLYGDEVVLPTWLVLGLPDNQQRPAS